MSIEWQETRAPPSKNLLEQQWRSTIDLVDCTRRKCRSAPRRSGPRVHRASPTDRIPAKKARLPSQCYRRSWASSILAFLPVSLTVTATNAGIALGSALPPMMHRDRDSCYGRCPCPRSRHHEDDVDEQKPEMADVSLPGPFWRRAARRAGILVLRHQLNASPKAAPTIMSLENKVNVTQCSIGWLYKTVKCDARKSKSRRLN